MGGDGMSDLVKRLRAHNAYKYTGISTHAAADRIEMLEREVSASYANQVSLINRVEQLERELSAEKAMADQYKDALSNIAVMGFSDDPAVAANIARYAVEMARKARGL